jgi:NADPH-dependent 2,4-dienoyl-CoA reductase/sulfur reductase-like enzyme
MTNELTRRTFTRLIGVAGATGVAGSLGALEALAQATPAPGAAPAAAAKAAAKAKVVIIGGGAGGASCAVALKKAAPELDVTLVEVNPTYTSCFYSNLYFGGFRTLPSLTHNYDGVRKLGVRMARATATGVDHSKKSVALSGGGRLAYDRLVLAPGIDFIWESVPGYSQAVASTIPHAWKAGPQTRLLKSQIEAMKDGGTVVMVAPDNPYRCPPGPYERASMIAWFLKTRKPKSKLVLLDPKKSFSKQAVFVEGWAKHYPGLIDLKLSTEIDNHAVARLDPKTRQIETKAGFKVKADVANVVPNQKAGEIAFKAGCTEGNWCPVNPETFESRKVPGIYVLGDAAVAAEMPKSAFSANSQAKVVAGLLAAELAQKPKFPPRFRNTCWSLIAKDDSIKIGANYSPKEGKLAPEGSFVSQPGEAASVRAQNYQESEGWYSGITADMFNKA